MKKIILFLAVISQAFWSNAQTNEDFKNLSTDALTDILKEKRFFEDYKSHWDIISEENIAWYHRLWRTLKLAENPLLGAEALDHSLASIFYKGIWEGAIMAYKGDRFTDQLTYDEVRAMREMDWSRVSTFSVKEDWIYLKEEQKAVCRVIGIAPVIDGKEAFWLYYPNIREYIADYKVMTADKRVDNLDKVIFNHAFVASVDKVGRY